MITDQETSLYLALIHHPVLNKKQEVIGSAFTNLDIHDIARMARTYGIAEYFIASPYEDQHQLITELLNHGLSGYGAKYNPARKEALKRVRLVWSLEEILANLEQKAGQRPLVITTSAAWQERSISYLNLRKKLDNHEPVLILFGTAHGLAPEIVHKADYSLPPIHGGTSYNHLSVRSAAAIIVDRLLGS